MSQTIQNKKIAIVGGGIAGLYTAWRILKHSQCQTDLTIFEGTNRIGGRILSKEIDGMPFRAELGAMRFRKNHILLNELIETLGLTSCRFDLPAHMFYLRGRKFSMQELVKGRCSSCNATLPFSLKKNEQNKKPHELVMMVIQKTLEDLNFPSLSQSEVQRIKRRITNNSISLEKWLQIRKQAYHGDIPLYQIGFWNLLQHYLSNEAYTLVRDGLSLDSVTSNWNAAEAIPWFYSDFSSDELLTIREGFSGLAKKLEDEIKTNSIKKNASVFAIEQNNAKWMIKYNINGEDIVEDDFDVVILAVPKVPLEKLKINHSQLSWPTKWINWVKPHRLFKVFLVYQHVWWIGDKIPGAGAGRAFTDLPLRQVYYFSPKWMLEHSSSASDNNTKSLPKGPAMVMASYSDEYHVSFWDPTEGPHVKYDRRTSVSAEFKNVSKDDMATERMVEKVHQQLRELHGWEIPRPLFGIYEDWGSAPFYGGWHTWQVGSKPWEIGKEITQPVEGLFICGEAYSREQGWIEGALKTSESVLELLGVPSYLDSNTLANIGGLPDYLEEF